MNKIQLVIQLPITLVDPTKILKSNLAETVTIERVFHSPIQSINATLEIPFETAMKWIKELGIDADGK